MKRSRPRRRTTLGFAPAAPIEKLVSAKQMAYALDCSTRTLRRFVQAGKVPYVRLVPSGSIRFRPKEVMDALTVNIPAKPKPE